ncbi:MAG: NAD-dependent epimerase/dehydratase family protein [Thermoplasmata archaeon]|nr:NAD-dependent epimerase/dehydratase family protein [Thermoplasmata archaeon]
MKVVLFGASGMVGQGVLRECLREPSVEAILSVGRTPTRQHAEKLREVLLTDLTDLRNVEDRLRGYDAGFFCLGISSAGMSEEAYRRVTYDVTVAVAQTLARLNPGMTFVYVSGAGTDSTERGGSMWARVKGQTENALLRLPFKAAYMFRPGIIQPLHGIRSKTRAYRAAYAVMWPLIPLLKWVFPNSLTTTERVGRAMIRVATVGAPQRLLGTREINELGK